MRTCGKEVKVEDLRFVKGGGGRRGEDFVTFYIVCRFCGSLLVELKKTLENNRTNPKIHTEEYNFT